LSLSGGEYGINLRGGRVYRVFNLGCCWDLYVFIEFTKKNDRIYLQKIGVGCMNILGVIIYRDFVVVLGCLWFCMLYKYAYHVHLVPVV